MTSTEAWDRYISTVRTGGTPDQRAFAFDRWWRLERQEHAHDARAQKKKTAEAVR